MVNLDINIVVDIPGVNDIADRTFRLFPDNHVIVNGRLYIADDDQENPWPMGVLLLKCTDGITINQKRYSYFPKIDRQCPQYYKDLFRD